MLKKHLLLPGLMVIMCVAPAFGQGEFFKSEESGFGVALEKPADLSRDELSLTTGYSIKGYVDLGLSIASLETASFPFTNYTVWAPYVSAYPLKQGYKGLPFSLQITSGYQWYQGRYKREYFALGAATMTNINVTERVLVQPKIAVAGLFPVESRFFSRSVVTFGLTSGVRANGRIMLLAHFSLSRADGYDESFEGYFGGGIVIRTGGK